MSAARGITRRAGRIQLRRGVFEFGRLAEKRMRFRRSQSGLHADDGIPGADLYSASRLVRRIGQSDLARGSREVSRDRRDAEERRSDCYRRRSGAGMSEKNRIAYRCARPPPVVDSGRHRVSPGSGWRRLMPEIRSATRTAAFPSMLRTLRKTPCHALGNPASLP